MDKKRKKKIKTDRVIGHDLRADNAPKRTGDVIRYVNIDSNSADASGNAQATARFSDLELDAELLRGLNTANFFYMSPIQEAALPLARLGADILVQAKAGTGKTCVFAVTCLEMIHASLAHTNALVLQALILCPTREIAHQNYEVMQALSRFLPHIKSECFIGGLSLQEDIAKTRGCNVAIGTPGRLKFLIEKEHLNVDRVRLFAMDEADQLFHEDFVPDINFIFNKMPVSKQVLTLSATFQEALLHRITQRYMQSPVMIRLKDSHKALLGIRQYFTTISSSSSSSNMFAAKCKRLLDILNCVRIDQALIFTNYQTTSEDLRARLAKHDWPASVINAKLDQEERLHVFHQLQTFKCRVLIATDLMARGIDVANVNLVVNFDVPRSAETYLHRIGRAGRFGGFGAAISLIFCEEERELLARIQSQSDCRIVELPLDPIPSDLSAAAAHNREDGEGMQNSGAAGGEGEIAAEQKDNQSERIVATVEQISLPSNQERLQQRRRNPNKPSANENATILTIPIPTESTNPSLSVQQRMLQIEQTILGDSRLQETEMNAQEIYSLIQESHENRPMKLTHQQKNILQYLCGEKKVEKKNKEMNRSVLERGDYQEKEEEKQDHAEDYNGQEDCGVEETLEDYDWTEQDEELIQLNCEWKRLDEWASFYSQKYQEASTKLEQLIQSYASNCANLPSQK